MNEFLTVIGLVLTLFGTIFVYDARLLSKNKIFNRFDTNTAVRIIKSVGFIIAVGRNRFNIFFYEI